MIRATGVSISRRNALYNVKDPYGYLNRGFKLMTKGLLNSDGNQSYVVKRTLSHPPDIFYDVVSDVSSYSDFVPYCTKSFINVRDQRGEPTEAGLRIGWRSFDETFVCDLECEPKKVVVARSVTHSLFQHLYTKWTISPTPRTNSCEMELLLKYKFNNPIYNRASSLFAESVSNLVIDAFNKRAAQLRREYNKKEQKSSSRH